MKRVMLIALTCACVLHARASAQACRIVPAEYEPLPERPQTEDPWKAPYPEPPPNAEISRLLGEAKAASARGDERTAGKKMQEAVRAMDRWSKAELRRLHKSGMSAAGRGGPRAPKEVSDIVHVGRQASALGVETNAIMLAGEVLTAYYNVRLKQLRATGMQAAGQAQPHPPDEFREALYLEQQLQTLLPSATSNNGMELARELYTAWGNARLDKLAAEAESIETPGERLPRQAGEALKIAQEIRTLGGSSEASLSARADRIMREILEGWAEKRAAVLRASGDAEAAQANEQPPEALAKLLGIERELQKVNANVSEVSRAATAVITAWVDAHLQKLSPPGHAAASAGGPRTPEEVARLVALSKQLDCLPDALASAAEPLRSEARAIGEKHLTAFREKLDCPATADDLASLRDIAGALEAYGWGPYDKRGPACGWRGTIVQRTEQTSHRDTVAHPAGQPIRYKFDQDEWTEIRWEVDGDFARVTVTGGGSVVDRNTALGPSCGLQDNLEVQTKSIQFKPKDVPFKVTHLRQEEYLIETQAPSYTIRTDTHVKRADSQACPLKGGESRETSTFDARAASVVLPDTAILIESLTGGRPSRELKGELVVSTPLNHGKLSTKITWHLVRER